MVNLLFAEDNDALTGPAPVRTLYDPAAGTGGMLTIASNYLAELNPNAHLEVIKALPQGECILVRAGTDPEHVGIGISDWEADLTNTDAQIVGD
jgi:type I restriction enzyme M protein